MDLIASIVASIVTFVAGLLGNILAHDICASADRTCARIIHTASRRLAPFDCEPVEQEWLADLYERATVREKYQHAIGCFLSAGKMRRQAQTVIVLRRGRHRATLFECDFATHSYFFCSRKLQICLDQKRQCSSRGYLPLPEIHRVSSHFGTRQTRSVRKRIGAI